MKIAIAQTRPIKGDIDSNIQDHIKWIGIAAANGADYIFFPELSVTSYQSELAAELAITMEDDRLDIFQELSNDHTITIGVGMPTIGAGGILISMIVFTPNNKRQVYSKQLLHEDELPFFIAGQNQLMIDLIAPAICYESLQPSHVQHAHQLGAKIYVSSVAKSYTGVEKAYAYYPELAKEYDMPVFMSNCLGPCDDFMSAGYSSVWNRHGELLAQLNDIDPGLIIWDEDSDQVQIM